MKKVLFLILLIVNICFSEEINEVSIDLKKYEDKQNTLIDVRNIITYEESIATAYEYYILEKYDIPTLSDIQSIIGTLNIKNSNISLDYKLDSSITKISYGLKKGFQENENIKLFYESPSYRNRTYYRNDEIYFMLKNPFAKHLYYLIRKYGKIEECQNAEFIEKNCIEKKHIYIQFSKKKEKDEAGKDIFVSDGYLMTYHLDRFQTGPIVITNNTAKYSSSHFESIPRGAILYDTDGKKYIKTPSGIKSIQ